MRWDYIELSDECHAEIPALLKGGPMSRLQLQLALKRSCGPVAAALERLIREGVVMRVRTPGRQRVTYGLGREPEPESSRIAGPVYRRGLVWGNARPRRAA